MFTPSTFWVFLFIFFHVEIAATIAATILARMWMKISYIYKIPNYTISDISSKRGNINPLPADHDNSRFLIRFIGRLNNCLLN